MPNGGLIGPKSSSNSNRPKAAGVWEMQEVVDGRTNNTWPSVVSDGLKMFLDASNPDSYTAGATTWYDLSGNGNNATGAAAFMSTTDGLRSGSVWQTATTALLNDDTHSIFFSIRFNSSTTYPQGTSGTWEKILGYTPSGTDRSPGIWRYAGNRTIHWRFDPGNTGIDFNSSTFGQYVGTNDQIGLGTGNPFALNTWYYVGVVKNGATISAYVNGVLFGSYSNAANPKTSGTSPIYLFQDYGYSSANLDNIQIYDRPLTDAEVSQNFQASKGRLQSIPTAYLVVGGGGGGGKDMGGGGGAGGYVSGFRNLSPNTTYYVTVGDGGIGSPAASSNGENTGHQYTKGARNGKNSTFGASRLDQVVALGGGFGGSSYFDYTPNNGYGGTGGSGGGATGYSNGNTGRQGFTNQLSTLGYGNGNHGGNNGGQYYSGGGGGAGGVGASGSNQADGGIGIQNDILGTNYYWAGGGGGAGYSREGGNGGSGGGGAGAVGTKTGGSGLNAGENTSGGSTNSWANVPGGNGGANTGGGGGGGAHYNATNKGGDGGSGIVVLRYQDFYPDLTVSPGLTYTRTTVTGYKIYSFLSGSGSVTTGVVSSVGQSIVNDSLKFYLDPIQSYVPNAENLVAYSIYNSSAWTVYYSPGSINASGITAPDGANTAARFTMNGSGSTVLRVAFPSFTPNGTDQYTVSFFARKVSGTTTTLSSDLSDGFSLVYGSQLLQDNWVRISYTGTPPASSIGFIDLVSDNSSTCVVDFWGVQLEKNSSASPVLLSNGSTIARGAGWKNLATSWNNPIAVNAPKYQPSTNSIYYVAERAQYLSVGNFGTWYPQGTIQFWMYSEDVANYRNPLHSHFQGTNTGFRFEQYATNNFGMLFGNDAGTYTSHTISSGGFYPYRWVLITVTWNTATGRTVGYVNNTQVFDDANTTWASSMPSLTLGGGFSSESARQFAGRFGPVMVYNKQLTSTEVVQNYNALLPRYKNLDTTPKDGLSSATAGESAAQLRRDYGYYTDGLYWIYLPGVGAQQVYCIMNPLVDGGGWMMAMKATRGTTFNYDANYWTTANTLNTTSYNRNDGDAKFDVMNYYEANDIMAIWPDLGYTGGSVNVSGYNWTWVENNFNNGVKKTLINFFATTVGTTGAPGGSGFFKKDAKTFAGWGSGKFSGQTDIRFYGFNYASATTPYNAGAKVRWGFGWNENGEGLFPGVNGAANGSNDVSGGIGMSWSSYSAGDQINCCNDTTGVNRSARVEVYVR
jgi:hypothetical protein